MMRTQTRAKEAKIAKEPTSVGQNASSLLSARDRLLVAADELFYAEGVHVVGIDRIVERAGVAKATLYSIFGSKDELVRAYLENHFRQRQRGIGNILAAHNTPRERLLGIFAEIEAALEGSEFRGCRFISAGAEARPGDASEVVADRYRAWLRSLFVELAQAAGAHNAKAVGRQLSLLYDGAAVAARMDQDRRGAATAVHAAAVALLDAAIPAKNVSRQPKTG
jgi:AcrR family transcriptional regulator